MKGGAWEEMRALEKLQWAVARVGNKQQAESVLGGGNV